MVVCLYNCEGLKTLHELGAKLRKFNELEKKERKKMFLGCCKEKFCKWLLFKWLYLDGVGKGQYLKRLKA